MITIVIPCRENGNPYITLRSLAKQTLLPTAIVVVFDQGKGANWARNRGFELVKTPYVLFSDDDIEWESYALESMYNALQVHSQASYAYGWYYIDDLEYSGNVFNAEQLCINNYVSTMSLIRSIDFTGFDENILRLQDWDLWLTMLEQGKTGVHCGNVLFETKKRVGITFGGDIDWAKARYIVAKKHGLLR